MARMVANLDSAQHSERIRAMLRGRTPGTRADAQAAVLMLFTGDSAAAGKILLTHRTPTMRSHSGQMAFPGGGIDATDRGPVDAALREAWEETGLERRLVSPLAALESVTTGGSRRIVRPVLAYAADPGDPHIASPAETDDVFFAAVADLIAPENRLIVGLNGYRGPAFWSNGYLIWGFTGLLLDVLFDAAGWTRAYDSTVVPLGHALRDSRNGERHP